MFIPMSFLHSPEAKYDEKKQAIGWQSACYKSVKGYELFALLSAELEFQVRVTNYANLGHSYMPPDYKERGSQTT